MDANIRHLARIVNFCFSAPLVKAQLLKLCLIVISYPWSERFNNFAVCHSTVATQTDHPVKLNA
jgi:hypothetical protein